MRIIGNRDFRILHGQKSPRRSEWRREGTPLCVPGVAGLSLNFDQCKFTKEEEKVIHPEELLKQYYEMRSALDANIDQTLNEIQQMLGIEIK